MTTPLDHPEAGGGAMRKQVPEDSLLVILKVAASRADRGSESRLGRSAAAAANGPKPHICNMQEASARFLERRPSQDARSTFIRGCQSMQAGEACKGLTGLDLCKITNKNGPKTCVLDP